MNAKVDKLIDDLVHFQGTVIMVRSYGHAGMPGDWNVQTTRGVMIGMSERVHGGNGITYDLILKSTSCSRLWSIALTRINSFERV